MEKYDLFTDVSFPQKKEQDTFQMQLPSEYKETPNYFGDLTVDDFSYRNIYGESVTEFEEDPEVIEKFEIVADYLADNRDFMSALIDPATNPKQRDVSEFLRDDVIRIGTKLNKAMKLENAPDEVKEAYRYISERFDKAETKGVGEFFGAVGDYTTDIVFNPETIVAVLAGIFTGGQSVGGQAVAHAGARAALAKALAKTAAVVNPSTPTGLAIYGGTFAGADNVAQQYLDVSVEKREKIDPNEVVLSSLIGAGAGYGLGKVFQYGKSALNKKNTEEAFEDASDDFFTDPNYSFETAAEIRARESFKIADESSTTGEVVIDNIPLYAPKLIEDFSEQVATKNIDPEEVVINNPQFRQMAEDVGGGEKTYDEIIDAAIAAAQGETKEKVNSLFVNKLYRLFSNASSGLFGGKASGVYSPYTSYSAAAKVLQQKFSREFAKSWTGPQKIIQEDFAEAQRKITGKYYTEFLNIVEPIAFNKLKGTMKDEVNSVLSKAIRGQFSDNKAINQTAINIKKMYEELGERLYEAKIIAHKVDNYVPRMWNRKAIENNADKFKSLLVEEGEAANLAQADDIVKEMLDKTNQLDTGTHGHFFSAKRKFDNITNDAKFEEFLNNDVVSSFYTYIYQAGKSLAKQKVFGVRNENEFKTRWINTIAEDHLRATGKALPRAERERMLQTYRLATSENLDRYSDGLQNVADGYNFVTRVATLPLATISSLSEILINISKAGVVNSIKGFSEATEVSFKRITKDMHSDLMTKHGLTSQEAWRELYEHSIAVDHGLSQIGNRLAGDDLMNDTIQKASNKFFRINFLDQWTKFAQLTSYSTGKRLIESNAKALAELGSGKVTKNMQNKIDELAELGIDYNDAVAWYKGGAKANDPFYKTVKEGAARYTNDIILQPTSMSSMKPRLYSNPQTSIFFNLLSYPAAFSNTILKGAAKQMVRNPSANTAKVFTAGLLMTESQRYLNYVRSRGESEKDKTPAEARLEAIKRWGGNGLLFDQIERARRTAMYSGKPASYVFAPFGPLPSDIINVYNRPWSTAGTKVPGYAAGTTILGRETMSDYREFLKDLDRSAKDIVIPDKPTNPGRDAFAKGGVVDVPNAPAEPDERIDKMTGVPYNVQAGSAFVDEEDPIKSLLN
jgi:hypothetical protein